MFGAECILLWWAVPCTVAASLAFSRYIPVVTIVPVCNKQKMTVAMPSAIGVKISWVKKKIAIKQKSQTFGLNTFLH